MELFFFSCDAYLGFVLLVALVYLNPGFLYEKNQCQKHKPVCLSFCFVTGTCLLQAYIIGYPAFC